MALGLKTLQGCHELAVTMALSTITKVYLLSTAWILTLAKASTNFRH